MSPKSFINKISRLIICIFCLATIAFANATDQLSDKLDLLPSVTIKTFENIPNRELLQKWIGDYDKDLVTDLTGSKWHTVDIPAMQTPDDLWLRIYAHDFVKNLLVITTNPASGKATVYFETDLLGNAQMSQKSYWLKLNQNHTTPPTKLFITQEFRDNTYLLRNLELMSALAKNDLDFNLAILTALAIGAVLALFAYNTALSVQLKSTLHAYYGLYGLTALLVFGMNINGLSYHPSWYDSLGISPIIIDLITIWSYTATTTLFIVKFLESRFRVGILVTGLSLCVVAMFVVTVACYFPGSSISLIPIYNNLAVLIAIQLLLLMARSWHLGSSNAPYMILAFTPVLIIGSLRVFIEQWGFFLTNGIQLGITFEMLILSWGLTEQVRRMRDAAEQSRERAEKNERDTICRLNEDLERKVVERTKDLEEKVIELEISKDEISTLKGILPICSYCKNIRDDEGSWEQMESYISSHTETQFSHGICPDCVAKVRKEAGLDKN